MMKHINTLFANLRKFDISELVILALTVMLLPWHWRFALIGVCALALNTIAKCVAYKHVGCPKQSWWERGVGLAVVLMGVWYAVSLLWTQNLDYGFDLVSKMASMVLVVVLFWASDTRYLTLGHIRMLLYLFALSLAALFLTRLCVNIHRVLTEDITFVSRMGFGFDRRHHTYISMYALVALWGLYSEQIDRWGSLPRHARALVCVLMVLLVADIVFVNSRAGVLFLFLSIFLMCGHAIFFRKRRMSGVLSCVVALGLVAGVHCVLPKTQKRVNQTSVTQEAADRGTTEQAQRKDKRLAIWQASVQLAQREWLMGVGIGDRFDELLPFYEALGDQESIDLRKNCHNQFLDTLVTTGIVGLLLLMALLGLMLVVAWLRKNLMLFAFALNIGFNCLFESVLDRQMGLLFFALTLMFLLYIPRVSNAPVEHCR